MESFEPEFLPELNDKDLRSIQKAFDKEKKRLENEDDFQSLSVEAKESLLASIQYTMYLAKRMAKKKFTPKKYRYWEVTACNKLK